MANRFLAGNHYNPAWRRTDSFGIHGSGQTKRKPLSVNRHRGLSDYVILGDAADARTVPQVDSRPICTQHETRLRSESSCFACSPDCGAHKIRVNTLRATGRRSEVS